MTPLIFLADDDALIRTVVELRLGMNGYQVQSASDGLAALEALADISPDLIILDFNMPRMGGLEVRKALSQNRRLAHVPVMMLTAAADPHIVNAAADLKVAAYLLKPFAHEALADRVRRLLQAPNAKARQGFGSAGA